MDSDSSRHHHLHHPPPQPHHHHHLLQTQNQNQPMMVGPTSSYPTANPNNANNTATASTLPPPPPSMAAVMSQQQQLIPTQNPNANFQRFPYNSMVNSSPSAGAGAMIEYSDGSGSSPRTSGFNAEPARKKRGRPRKYAPDGNVGLGLSPAPLNVMSPGSGQGDNSGGGTPSSEPPAKRGRGRPPGSGKKQQQDALGSTGAAFTPHLITVNPGEDVAARVLAFAHHGDRSVCVMSATGAISNVTLQQSGGAVTYEGRFLIIHMSGAFNLSAAFYPSETNGSRNRSGGLCISLAGSDGRVLGGGVGGTLTAASPVQVLMGSFIEDRKKRKSALPPPAHAPNMLNFGAPATAGSSPSQDGSSNSSDDDDDSPPIRHGPGPYNNAGQPMQGMHMYANMGWPN